MQLLVSVRSADEARVALAAGAHILDAKEPADGALAPVPPLVLGAIAAVVPAGTALSVALGEPVDVAALEALLAARAGVLAARPAFIKFVPPTLAPEALGAMVACARAWAPSARVVAATYVDRRPAVPLADARSRAGRISCGSVTSSPSPPSASTTLS